MRVDIDQLLESRMAVGDLPESAVMRDKGLAMARMHRLLASPASTRLRYTGLQLPGSQCIQESVERLGVTLTTRERLSVYA